MRKLFWGGIHPEGHKDLSRGAAPVPAPLPAQVVLPMLQHIGAACTPVVKVGDQVRLGQKIGDGEGVCAPIHASVSGKVVAVEPRPHPNGQDILSVVIENDYMDTPDDTLKPHLTHKDLSPEEILRVIRDAGIVGMGGATFPTDVKAFSALGQVDYVIINACECEPYITADDTLLCTYPEQVTRGTEILLHALTPRHTVIAVEDNKQEAIRILGEALPKAGPIELRVLPTRYPQGAEKQLIQAVTGRQAWADLIFKAAAVADYTPADYHDDKVKKKDGDLSIPLRRTQDILQYLGDHRRPGQVICGFSMETRDLLANSAAKLEKKHVDMICANNLKVAGAGFGTDTNVLTLITAGDTEELPLMSKEEAAGRILDRALALAGQ